MRGAFGGVWWHAAEHGGAAHSKVVVTRLWCGGGIVAVWRHCGSMWLCVGARVASSASRGVLGHLRIQTGTEGYAGVQRSTMVNLATKTQVRARPWNFRCVAGQSKGQGRREPDQQGSPYTRESRILASVRPRMQAAGLKCA